MQYLILCLQAIAVLLLQPAKASPESQVPPPVVIKFAARPLKAEFREGDKVKFVFRVKNAGQRPVLAARPRVLDYYVLLRVYGPDGKEIPWCGKIDGRLERPGEFVILSPEAEVSSIVTVSCDVHKDAGFVFDQRGAYKVVAEYHMPQTKTELQRRAGTADIFTGVAKAAPVLFRVIP